MTGLSGYIRGNLSGAWAVMLGRPEGLHRLDTSLEGFWRSFAVVVLLLPFVVLALLSQKRLAVAADETPEPFTAGGLSLDFMVVVVDWFAFPLIFALLANVFALGPRYVSFIVARNWASLIIAALMAILHALHVVGVLPSAVMPWVLLAAIGVSLRFAYVIARTALAVGWGMAVPIVVVDLLISLTIWSAFDRMTQPSP